LIVALQKRRKEFFGIMRGEVEACSRGWSNAGGKHRLKLNGSTMQLLIHLMKERGEGKLNIGINGQDT